MKLGYTPDSIWRNRDTFLQGHDQIEQFLTKKWEKENGYRLRKELFSFTDNKVGHYPQPPNPFLHPDHAYNRSLFNSGTSGMTRAVSGIDATVLRIGPSRRTVG